MLNPADLDPALVVDIDLSADSTRIRWRELAAEWAQRPPFYVVNYGIPQVVAARYDDVREVFLSPERISTTPPPSSEERFDPFMGLPHMIVMNGLPHDRVRRILQPTFSTGGIDQYAPAIERHVHALFDEIEAGGNEFDAVPDLTMRLIPRILLGEMFGISEERQEAFIRMNSELETVATAGGYPTAYVEAFEAAREVIEQMIKERTDEPTDDFISRLIQGRDQGEPVTDEEIFANVFAICVAAMTSTGTESTVLLYHWTQYREQFATLVGHPERIPDAVEESLRFHPAGLFVFPQFATGDTELGGVPIPKGTPVWPCVAAANFDPTHYPDPLRFDIARKPKHILTFGAGAHYCVGGILARRIMCSLLEVAMSRYPDLDLVDPDFAFTYHGQLGETAPTSMPLRLR